MEIALLNVCNLNRIGSGRDKVAVPCAEGCIGSDCRKEERFSELLHVCKLFTKKFYIAFFNSQSLRSHPVLSQSVSFPAFYGTRRSHCPIHKCPPCHSLATLNTAPLMQYVLMLVTSQFCIPVDGEEHFLSFAKSLQMNRERFLDFKLSPFCERCVLPFGWFPGVPRSPTPPPPPQCNGERCIDGDNVKYDACYRLGIGETVNASNGLRRACRCEMCESSKCWENATYYCHPISFANKSRCPL
jgi:hypothetical protein